MHQLLAFPTLLVALSAGIPAAAQTPVAPDCPAAAASTPFTPAAAAVMKLATDWFEVMNTGDEPAFLQFVKERGPALLYTPSDWLELRQNLRGMHVCGLESADAKQVNLWVHDPSFDGYAVAQFGLGATPGEKPRLLFVAARDDVPPGASRPARLALPALIEAVSARADERHAIDRFDGAVLVAQGSQVLFQKAYGLADREKHQPNTLDTQFRFGSMGKMFTAVAILQLVEAGKIALDAPIGRYLPDYPDRGIATTVTVANLLTHTGGTGDIFGPEFDANKASLRTLQDYVALYGKRPAAFAPGEQQAYSNYGFILLGRIVETVSGGTHDAYIQRHIFDSAGMASTGNQPESTLLPRRAVSYMGMEPRLQRADRTLPLSGTSAGGGYATVGDFQRFILGLTGHRLLRAETLRQLIEGGVRLKNGSFVPFDFGGTMPGSGRYIGHGGGAPGMSGSLMHFLDSGITIAVLANRDPGTAESVALFAAHRLPVGPGGAGPAPAP
ncbi:CubicO group peptidase, beta-lactamase class C family [Sphingomonas sp. NFR04]|uniref:serine hydrolase domain-containing protein n=1 Tax=Sphingomonas sp. NFR04 TaxID=1566283 RepID=UPI0008F160FC|nr:serine hydrolase domain-containing protein [Sphingomonas sp. NFR04]SFK04844.1 CubicO group peptidase, beta-lactamase class C family [Sphingomonas sp. NFR04]